MRSSLLHPLAERHSRRHRPKRREVIAYRQMAKPAPVAHQPRDIAVERVRAAGGPLDEASYACECGFLFAAPVSTTVACPHCGAGQAW
jgi:hypothetical protein